MHGLPSLIGTSPDDRAREKLAFYAKVGTREVLLVDRDPWALELFRLREGRLAQVSRSTTDNGQALEYGSAPSRPRLQRNLPYLFRLECFKIRRIEELTTDYTD